MVLAGALAPEDDFGGLQHDHQVQQEAVVFDVIEIVLQFRDGVLLGGTVLVLELGPAGDAGLHRVAFGVEGNVLLELRDELGPLGAGPDDAHLAAENVQELWQLIEAELAQHRTHSGDARVVLLRPLRLARRLRIFDHAAELEHVEVLAVQPDPPLTVEHRSAESVLQLDGQGAQRHHRQGDHHRQQAHEQVQTALGRPAQRRDAEAGGEDHPARVYQVDADFAGLALQETEQIETVDAANLAGQQLVDRQIAAAIVHGDHNLVGFALPGDREQRTVMVHVFVATIHAAVPGGAHIGHDAEATPVGLPADLPDGGGPFAGTEDEGAAAEDVLVGGAQKEVADTRKSGEGDQRGDDGYATGGRDGRESEPDGRQREPGQDEGHGQAGQRFLEVQALMKLIQSECDQAEADDGGQHQRLVPDRAVDQPVGLEIPVEPRPGGDIQRGKDHRAFRGSQQHYRQPQVVIEKAEWHQADMHRVSRWADRGFYQWVIKPHRTLPLIDIIGQRFQQVVMHSTELCETRSARMSQDNGVA